jgi:hypothetical protein
MLQKLFEVNFHLWLASFANIAAIVAQLRTILKNRSAKDVSVLTWCLFLYIQITYSVAGYKADLPGQFWGMGGSAIVSCLIVFSALVFRFWNHE